jgi:hypothetical protein
MEPWYYLDLELKYEEYDGPLELIELSSVYPDGSWNLKTEGYQAVIIYNGKEYTSIEFNNTSKKMKCYGSGNIDIYTLTVTLTLS